mgnify:CR=1 FL=1
MADGKVIISTLLDNGGLEKGLKSVSGTLGGLAKTVAGVAASITAAFGAAAIAITKQAVDAYADYEQLVGGVETLFKDAADKVAGYAENAFYTVGISANEYMETVTSFSASLISSLAGDTAKAAEVADMALTDMADNANKMGTPLESIKTAYQGFAKQNYTMLDNLKLGYGGTKTEMERLLKDAQKLTGVKYDISNLSDVYNAIHAIQVEMGIAGTTAKEAEKTITGSANMTKAAWNNVLTALAGGGDLDKAIDNLVYSLSRYFDNMVPVVERSLEGIGVLIERVAPKLVETVAASLIRALPGLVNAVYQMLVGLVNGIYSGIAALLSGNIKEVGKQLNEDLKSSAAGADKLTESIEKAGKAAKKSLAPFDEIARLSGKEDDPDDNSPTIGSNGSGGSNPEDLPKVEAATDKLTNIREILEEVVKWTGIAGAAFGGFKLGGFITSLLTANMSAETLKDTLMLFGKKGLLTGGITLAITGLATEIMGIIDTVVNGLDGINFAEILGGGGALVAGAALIGKFFADVVLGTSIGAIIAGVPMYFTGIYDAVVKGLNWLNGSLIGIGATLAGTGIGAIIGFCGGPIGAGVGALIGLVVGLLTDAFIWLWQHFDAIEEWFNGLPGIAKSLVGAIAGVAAAWISFAGGGVGLILAIGSAIIVVIKKFDDIKAAVADAAEKIKEYFQPAAEWFGELFDSIFQTVSDVFYNIGVIARGCWEIIKYVWDTGVSHIKTHIIEPVAAAFNSLWDTVSTKASEAWAKIKEVFGPAVQFVRTTLIDPIIKGFELLKEGIKGLINAVIGFLNAGLENSFGNINWLLSSMKNLNIGGMQPFADLKMINVPKIPYLAQGAVLPPNKPFMAVVGDQTHGTNVEAPLATIQEAVAIVMEDMVRSNIAGHEATVAVLREILEAVLGIHIGDDVIGQAVARYNAKMAVIRGGA